MGTLVTPLVRTGLRRALLGLMALTGAALLLAAGTVALVPWLGVAGALAMTGGVLLLAVGGMLIQQPPPPPKAQPDPLLQMVFDLSFNLGRSLRRRRD
jgi:hypothetical protein